MARTDSRGGPRTKARIALVASGLFVEHGFEAVTVAEIARAAGVSSVTVFKYFPRKEDLFFDRYDEAVDMLVSAVGRRAASGGLAHALRDLLIRLLDERHPFSGTAEESVKFFRTVAQAPALLARARQMAAEIQTTLTRHLDAADDFAGDAALTSAFFVAGYARILTETATDLIDGEHSDELTRRHRGRIERLIDALVGGVLPPAPAGGTRRLGIPEPGPAGAADPVDS